MSKIVKSQIEQIIYVMRGTRVMLDSDLAQILELKLGS